MKVVRDAWVDRLGTLPREHAGQSSNGPYRHPISGAEHKLSSKGLWTRGRPSKHAEGRPRGAVGVREILELPGAAEAHLLFGGGCPDN